MAGNFPSHSIYEFGDFRVDASEMMLYRAGEEVSLPPKAVETLLALIARRGQIISKDELMDTIWSDAVVEESNLSRYIHVLRATLGTQPNGKQYIETFRRRGYRFNAEIAEVRDQPVVSPTIRAFSPIPVGGGAIREATTGNVIAVAEWRRETDEVRKAKPGSDAEGVPPEAIGQEKKVSMRWFVLPATIIVLVGISAAVYFSVRRSSPLLADKDIILIADFDNKTGDEIFDGTLKQGLSIQLQQSPYLSLFPDERAQNTLKLMKRSPDARITKDIAREICRRQGLKAFVLGSIAQFGNRYAITIEAINALSGATIAGEQMEADGKEQVIRALGQAADNIRAKLGDSLGSIEKPQNAPLEYTTSSLEALSMLAAAQKEANTGNYQAAIYFATKATEIDPEFASAHRTLAVYYSSNRQRGLAVAPATLAFELRDRVSELERLSIELTYHRWVTGEFDKMEEVGAITKRLFPRHIEANASLAEMYLWTGSWAKAIEEANAAIEKGSVRQYSVLYIGLRSMGRYGEAKAAIARSIEQGTINFRTREVSAELAFLGGDDAGFQEQMQLLEEMGYKARANQMRTDKALFEGKVTASTDIQKRFGSPTGPAVNPQLACLGDCGAMTLEAESSQKPAESEFTLTRDAFAYALCRRPADAELMVREYMESRPKGTMVNDLVKPLIDATVKLEQGDAINAVELLRGISLNLESASYFRVQYIRGRAYLKLQKGPEAAAEFQKILDHRGEAIFSPLYPLAYLGLARAQVLTGDFANARANYDRFFEIWKDADNDLAPLREARSEYKENFH